MRASVPAQGPSRAMRSCSARSGAACIEGICTASTPPGAMADSRRGNSVSCPPSHCSAALLNSTSTGSAGAQVAMSACAVAKPDPAALASIAAEPSTPVTVASGKRAASSGSALPAPQPRSTTRLGAGCGMRPIRSSAGRRRSSSKRRYCVASQLLALTGTSPGYRRCSRAPACRSARATRHPPHPAHIGAACTGIPSRR